MDNDPSQTVKLLIWAIALFFTIGWPIAVWIKISRNEYSPRCVLITVLWFIPELWVVYKGDLSEYVLLWLMPLTFAIAFVMDMSLLRRHPGRSGGIDTFLVWLVTGIIVFPILIFM